MAADDDKRTHRHTAGDHSTFAAEENLDQYGVWVKSGPDDIEDEDTEDVGISDLEPEVNVDEFDPEPEPESSSERDDDTYLDSLPDLPGEEDLPVEDDLLDSSDLSEEEEQLLADLEDTDSDHQTPADQSEASPESGDAEEIDLEIPESDDDFSMDLDEEAGPVDFAGDETEDLSLDLPESDEPQPDQPFRDPLQAEDSAPDPGGQLEEAGADERNVDESDESEDESEGQIGAEDDIDIAFRYAESEEELPNLELDDSQELILDDEGISETRKAEPGEVSSTDEPPAADEPVETPYPAAEYALEESYADSREDFAEGEDFEQEWGLEPTEVGEQEKDLDDALDLLDDEGEESPAQPVTEIALEPAGDEEFDDVSAVTSELSAPVEESRADEPRAAESAAGAYSQEAFDQIQSELSSIRSELSALKAELQGLRGVKPSSAEPAVRRSEPDTIDELESEESVPAESPPIEQQEGQAEHPETQTDRERPATEPSEGSFISHEGVPEDSSEEADFEQVTEGGFFEEDEDETIALTGDELDNILNTAEFTEEEGQPTDPDEGDIDLDLSAVDSSTPDQSDESRAESEEVVFDDIDGEHSEEPSDSDAFTFQDAMEDEALPEEDELPEDLIVTLDTDDSADSDSLEDGPADDSSASVVSGDEAGDMTDPEELFGASEDHVDALANMDIDTELADIEELDDESDGSTEKAAESQYEDDQYTGDTEATAEGPTGQTGEHSSSDAAEPVASSAETQDELPENLREEIKQVLSYMDQLLESLPEEKIREFANSEHFEVYKRLFEELGLEP